MNQIEIFSRPGCHYCDLAKNLLKSLEHPYTEYNVMEDPAKKQELMDMGAMGVPVIRVTHANGEKEVIMGYDEDRLREVASNK